jgi:hypothetical protein
MNKEKLKIKVGLSGTYWGDNTPEYAVLFDGVTLVTASIAGASGEIVTVELDVEASEGVHSIAVQLLNKDPVTDVVKNPDDSIAKDMLLNIESIEIDDIDLGHLRYTMSKYQLDKKQLYNNQITDQIDNCINLGFNGRYILEFSSPFYIWLLENM